MTAPDTQPEVTTIDELEEAPHAEVFETRRPRVVRLQLDPGESVPPHTHPESDVVIHVVEGEMELSLDGESYDLEAGQTIRFSGLREVSPEAKTEAIALVVFAPREEYTEP